VPGRTTDGRSGVFRGIEEILEARGSEDFGMTDDDDPELRQTYQDV
jgi:hypothetical protein